MPTHFIAQNGLELKQETPIEVTGCSPKLAIVARHLKGRNLALSVYVPAAGKLKASGRGLRSTSKNAEGRETLTLTVHVNRGGKFKTKLNVTFTTAKGKKQAKSVSLRA